MEKKLNGSIESSGSGGGDGDVSSSGKIVSFLSSYSTVRLATIHSWKVAFFFRLMQTIIIGYIIGYLFNLF